MPSSKPDEKLWEKLRRLIAMEESPNENEAAVATAKASQILLEYNITRLDVENMSIEDQVASIMDHTVEILKKYIWEKNLLVVIAHFNLVKTVYRDQRLKIIEVDLMGLDFNVESVEWVWSATVERLKKLANESWKTYYLEVGDMGEKRGKYRRGFLSGAVDGVRSQLEAARAEAMKDQRSLIILENKLVVDYVKAKYPSLGTGKSRRGTSGMAGYGAGVGAGRTVNMAPNRAAVRSSGGQKVLR